MMEQKLVVNEIHLDHIKAETDRIKELVKREKKALEHSNKFFTETMIWSFT